MRRRLPLAAALLAAGAAAQAATITVNTTVLLAGDNLCSLIEARNSAVEDFVWDTDCVQGSGADTIEFDPAVFPAGSVIALSGPLEIHQASNTTIDGGGRVTLDAGGTGPVVTATQPGTTLTLRGLTLTGGQASPLEGGGIYADGITLNIDNSVVTGNTATSNGGGLFARDSTVTITGSRFTANTANVGGAIYGTGAGSLSITNSRFTGNAVGWEGGAIYSGMATTITGSVIDNNASPAAGAANRGAGIYFVTAAAFTVNNTRITNNTPGMNCGQGQPFTGTGNQYWPPSDTSCPAAAGRFVNPLAPPVAAPAAIPVDAPWALALLSALVAGLGAARRRASKI